MSDESPDDAAPDAPEDGRLLNAGPVAERGERIAKWLARAGIASRRDAEALIEGRVVTLNGRTVETPATFVKPGDVVRLRGAAVGAAEPTRLFRYHKPDGLVTTHRDPQGRRTVFEALPAGLPRLVSVGRLDLTSEGLLLLTNDGALARKLELPSNGWLRRYRVRVNGNVDETRLATLARGVTVDGVAYGPIQAGLDSRRGANAWLTVSLQEGKNREIRKVMSALHLHVSRLIRIAYGPFQLGALPIGAVEEVNARTMREQLGMETANRIPRGVERTALPPDAAPAPSRPPRARNAGTARPRR